jgi:hypothetical protein
MAYDEYGLNDQAMAAYEEEERRRRQSPTIPEAAGQAWDKFKGKFTDDSGDFSMGKYVANQLASSGGMNQQTAMEKQLMQGAGVSAQPGFMTGAQPGVAPVAPQQAQQPMMQPAQQPVNPQQSTFADRVAQNESGAGGYDAIFGYGNAGGDPSISAATGGRNLSELSIGEALKLGDSRMGNNSGALGKYQFLPSTLRGLMGSTGLTEDDKFDAASQEKLFQALSAANASSLERQGIQPNETNLALAHAVGAGGAAKLLDPNNASLNAADVLGLSGAGRTTNPQLNKPVSEYLADMTGKFGGGQQRNVASVGREMGMDEPGYGGTEALPIDTAIKNEDTASVLANAHSTVEQLAGIVSNPNESKLAKQVALNRMKTLSVAPEKIAEAQKKIDDAPNDPKAASDVANALKPPKDGKNEGSWLKALLLAKLGLSEAATREFALLGIGSTEHGINLDGKKGIVTMDAKGTIVKGYVEDKDGNSKDMSAEQIAKANEIAAKDKRGPSGATLQRDEKGNQWSVVPTTTGSKFYNVATGQEGRPEGRLTPVQGQTDTDVMNYKSRLAITEHAAKKQIDFTNDMSKMSTEARIAGFKEINNLRVMAGKEPLTPSQMGLTPSGNIIGMEPAAVPATGAAPYGGQGLQVPNISRPVVPAAPVAQQPAPVVEAPAVQPAPVVAPTAPVVEAPAVQPVTAVQPPAKPETKPEPTGVELQAQAAAATEAATKRAAQDVTNEKEVEIKRVANKEAAVTTLPHLEKIGELIEKSTGSGIGAKIDAAGNFIGYSTEGAKAIAQIAPLADKILKSVERFSGPQSDLDVASYKEASGLLADPTVPAEQKQAALRSVISILNKYAPDLDWSKAYRGKDREAYTWAQKNKDDPRAEVIRKQLGL